MNAELKRRKPKAGLLLIASPRFKNLYGPKRGTYGDRKAEAVKQIKETMDFLELVCAHDRHYGDVEKVSDARAAEMSMRESDYGRIAVVIARAPVPRLAAQQGVYTDTTKTRKSQRTLKFPQEIMDMLKEYKAEQDEQALKYGDKWVETDRLYTKWNGEPIQNGTPYFLNFIKSFLN